MLFSGDEVNAVEHLLSAEEGEKRVKSENSLHQVVKEKHSDLKAGYDYLTSKVVVQGGMEFEEPQVNSLWEMAKNASFTPQELDSLKVISINNMNIHLTFIHYFTQSDRGMRIIFFLHKNHLAFILCVRLLITCNRFMRVGILKLIKSSVMGSTAL